MRKRLYSFAFRFSHLPRALQLIWTASRSWTAVWAVLLVLEGVLPAASVYLTKFVVDSIVVAIEAGGTWETVQPALFFALLMAAVLLVTQALRSVLSWIRTAQGELIGDHIDALIQEKAVTVDFAFYESPEYFDRLHRVSSEASSRPLALLENIGSFVRNSITFLAVAAILLSYAVWLPVALLISSIPAFWVALYFKKKYHAWWENRTEDRRWTQYFKLMLTSSYPAAEVRLFDLGAVFRPAYLDLRARLRRERLDLEKRQMWAHLGAGFHGLLVVAAVMVWMGWRALRGLATLGDLALFYQAFNQGQNLMRGLLESMSQVYSNALFLGNLFDYLDQKPTVLSPPSPEPTPAVLRQGIRFTDVTFCYPGSERPALQNFNLTFPAGQTVAIVGENGAGKSTLLKLLLRFYDPQAGSIEMDGVDIREISIGQLWRMFTVLFQFPVQYHATAAENIALGDMKAQRESRKIRKAAQAAGVHETIIGLPDGYETSLGKWFVNGHELSGGEWQRLAMARAFYRRAPIIVLDEPTSMMDSWAEAEWFERVRTLAEGRIAIIITHRFTIARKADVIHVMRRGRIVESGAHEELLEKKGLYWQSWTTQMQPGTGSEKASNQRTESTRL